VSELTREVLDKLDRLDALVQEIRELLAEDHPARAPAAPIPTEEVEWD